MTPEQLLKLSSKAGKILLESGAEIQRTEDTICRLCEAFGVDEASTFFGRNLNDGFSWQYRYVIADTAFEMIKQYLFVINEKNRQKRGECPLLALNTLQC